VEELSSLVDRAQKGDLKAYAEIVRRFRDMAFGYAYAVLGDFHLAEDAAQEAFVDAYRHLNALRVPSAFPGWFRRIVFKHCDRLTRRKLLRLAPLDSAYGVPSPDLGPAEAAERREMQDAVLTAIRSLPENERTVTTLFHIDGYSQKDIADFLEVPVTTVDGRLRTSRRKLKERMLSMVDETLKSHGLPERFADVVAQMTFVIRRVNPLAEGLQSLTDKQLLGKTSTLKGCLARGEDRDSIKAEAFALVREACRRAWNMPLYDVQLVAGLILDQGWVAEVASGEGKTISCLPAAYMGVLDGMHVHVATLTDHLARRDAGFAEKVLSRLGVTVGCLAADHLPGKGERTRAHRRAYASDITYGWNLDFGFDHLRDTMRRPDDEKTQGPRDFAIIDEVDIVLIEEARTPLTFASRAETDRGRYHKADEVARELINLGGGERNTRLYEVDPDHICIRLTAEGMAAAEELCGLGSFTVEPNVKWVNLIQQALQARLLYEKDREYIVEEGSVMILDEATGRANPGREWADGLHQAVECKEGLGITGEKVDEAVILLKDYFRLYKKLAGVTGTAKQQASWFREAHGMDVAVVPTRYPMNRIDHEDRVYPDVGARRKAIVEEARHYSRDLGRPVLIGTGGIPESETLSDMLATRGIRPQVLNARPENVAREAEIIASAGRQEPVEGDSGRMAGTVTISTAMAGRGTAIDLGPGVVYATCKVPPPDAVAALGVGPEALFTPGTTKCCINCPEYDEETQCAHCFKPKVDAAFPHRGRTACRKEPPCGLHVIGSGRAELRRLDDQLRARAGRQGDPGSSRFFLSLQDAVMKPAVEELTAQGWLAKLDEKGISDRRVSAAIERVQRETETRNFGIMRALNSHRPPA